jgi:hypothetical protein
MLLEDIPVQPRFPYHSKGILILFPRFIDVSLIDISLTGAHVYLTEAQEINKGLPCSLRIVSPGEHQVVEVEAVSAYQDAGYIGLTLLNVTPGIEKAMRTLVEMNLGTEALLHRNLCELLHPLRPN